MAQLDIGDASLVFGRLDLADERAGETFYIGRVAVWDDTQEPITVDWRRRWPNPSTEPRAACPWASVDVGTSHPRQDPVGRRGRVLRRRQGRGRRWRGAPEGRPDARHHDGAGRTGRLGDIVATIQAEQDEIIRSELPGILVVQGGPGTGKTVVALHRAAYLLYTHRFRSRPGCAGDRAEPALPHLHRAGAAIARRGGRAAGGPQRSRASRPGAWIRRRSRGPRQGRSGDVARAARRREGSRAPAARGPGGRLRLQRLRFTVEQSRELVTEARRRFNKHNGARRFVRERSSRSSQPAAATNSAPPRSSPGSRPTRRFAAPSTGCGPCSRPSTSSTTSTARRR